MYDGTGRAVGERPGPSAAAGPLRQDRVGSVRVIRPESECGSLQCGVWGAPQVVPRSSGAVRRRSPDANKSGRFRRYGVVAVNVLGLPRLGTGLPLNSLTTRGGRI